MKPFPSQLLLSACLLVLIAGCGRPSPEANGETLTLAVRADVTGIFPNPPIANEAYSLHLNRAIFDGLVTFDSGLALRPALAEYWDDPDETTTVLVLRKGLRFSDGRPVTARDAAASLLAQRAHGWVTRDYVRAIESARALDDRRLEIKTRVPYHVLPFRLPFAFILPAAVIDRKPVPPVGTGPYVLTRWLPGRELELERNPFYRGQPPHFRRVRLQVVPDAQDRITKVLRNEAMLADSLSPQDVDRLLATPNVRPIVRDSLRVLFLGVRMDQPPFSDPRVRQAVDLALDRRELIRRALGGRPEPASQLVPRAVVGFNPEIPPASFDRERARRLLAAAGHPHGFAIRLDGPRNRYMSDREILDEVARQLAEVGIRVTVNALDKNDFFKLQGTPESKFFLAGWACESGDAGDALDNLMHSSGHLPDGGNAFGMSDPELDRLIDAGNSVTSRTERTALLRAALARVAELRPVLPLLVQTEAFLVSRRLKWEPPVSLALDVANMAEE